MPLSLDLYSRTLSRRLTESIFHFYLPVCTLFSAGGILVAIVFDRAAKAPLTLLHQSFETLVYLFHSGSFSTLHCLPPLFNRKRQKKNRNPGKREKSERKRAQWQTMRRKKTKLVMLVNHFWRYSARQLRFKGCCSCCCCCCCDKAP